MKPTGYLITNAAGDRELYFSDILARDRADGFTSEPLFTLEEAFSDIKEFLFGPGSELGRIATNAGWDLSETMVEVMRELLHRRKQDMFPTHEHADGGLYEFLCMGELKHPVTGEWEPAVCYRGLNGVRCFTTQQRWRARFVPLKQAMPLEKLLLAIKGDLAGNPNRITLASSLVRRMVDKLLDRDQTKDGALSREE